MTRKLISVLIANLFVAVPVFAQEFRLGGSVGVGGLYVDDDTIDAAKLNEYRDLANGVLSVIDVKGRSRNYYLDVYGENVARDDMFVDVRGGRYGLFKYQLYSDSLRHNFTFGARSPYSGVGTALQTIATSAGAVATVGNPALWSSYDIEYKRRKDGGALECSFNSPWYVRVDASQIVFDGNKLQSYAKGTSPGNGFVDFAIPVDYKTKNLSIEGGYASKRLQVSLNFLSSKFENENPVLRWSNNFFVGLDATPLASDNDYKRWSANAILKQLPLGSALAVRYTTSTAENDVAILPTMLSTGGTNPTSNPTSPVFRGDIKYDTYSLSLTSNPTRQIDTRLYLNHFEKKNESSRVDFLALPAGFGCGDNPQAGPPAVSDCDTELFSYKKKNYGVEAGFRLNPQNKFNAGFDYSDLERERKDSTDTEEKKYSLEWKNSSLDLLSARVKYQFTERRSNFVGGNLGVDANDPLFLQRFVARYDVSNLDQDLIKLALDFTPSPNVDFGVELNLKKNKYKDTVLGRTKDDRQELYLTAAFGDRDVFRVLAFADYEVIKYDSVHRTINAGACPLTSPNCFDPFQPATTAAFNWSARNRDTNSSFGLGFDWPVRERLMVKGSALWGRSEGDVAVTAQTLPNGAPAATLVPITNYGNNEKWAFNLKGIYRLNRHWELAGGYSYEELKFNDVQFNGYTYVVPVTPISASTSYLSGWYANPTYKANIVYLIAKYRF
ncbi:MAG: hypothetical protein OHK0044_08950 [Burkholderiaceae bacterium]